MIQNEAQTEKKKNRKPRKTLHKRDDFSAQKESFTVSLSLVCTRLGSGLVLLLLGDNLINSVKQLNDTSELLEHEDREHSDTDESDEVNAEHDMGTGPEVVEVQGQEEGLVTKTGTEEHLHV